MEQTLDFSAGLGATRVIEVKGIVPEEAIGTWGDTQSSSSVGLLTQDQWFEIVSAVSSSGLFRFEGEAITEMATHLESAFVVVSRSGRDDCVLGSMSVKHDDTHPTFFSLLDRLDALEQDIRWQASTSIPSAQPGTDR